VNNSMKKSLALIIAASAALLVVLAAALAQAAPAPPASTPTPAVAGAASTPPVGVVNINSATEEELMRLPGVGFTKATAIVAWRTKHGGKFSKVEELARVKGFGRKTWLKLKPNLTVDGKTTLPPKKGVRPAATAAVVAPHEEK
jgi:competence protein ComEA